MRSASCSCHGFWEPCGVGPLSSGSPCVEPCHGSVKPALVHEHQSSGVEVGSQPAPQAPCLLLAFLGYLRLFLIGQGPPGRRSMARLTVEAETTKPVCSSKASRCSSRVRSLVSCKLGGQPLLERRSLEAGTPGDRLWLYVSGFAAPLEPAFDGGHRHREGLCDFFPWHSAVDASQHPQSKIFGVWLHV